MIVPVIGNPHFSELIAVVEDELQTAGFELILADSHGDVDQEARRLSTLVGRRVDGLLIVAHSSEGSALAIRAAMRSVPVVQLDRRVDHLPGDFVGIDDDEAMRLLLEHLVERGVRAWCSRPLTTPTPWGEGGERPSSGWWTSCTWPPTRT
jgi:LacI family transcriptional regulator